MPRFNCEAISIFCTKTGSEESPKPKKKHSNVLIEMSWLSQLRDHRGRIKFSHLLGGRSPPELPAQNQNHGSSVAESSTNRELLGAKCSRRRRGAAEKERKEEDGLMGWKVGEEEMNMKRRGEGENRGGDRGRERGGDVNRNSKFEVATRLPHPDNVVR